MNNTTLNDHLYMNIIMWRRSFISARIEASMSPIGIATNVSLRAEYIVSDYGSAGLGHGVSLDNGTFRAGLGFQF
jgi:hypothetical protein